MCGGGGAFTSRKQKYLIICRDIIDGQFWASMKAKRGQNALAAHFLCARENPGKAATCIFSFAFQKQRYRSADLHTADCNQFQCFPAILLL